MAGGNGNSRWKVAVNKEIKEEEAER